MSNRETEAITLNRSDETYYKPFSNKPLVLQARAATSCESIQSLYVCASTPLCIWDNVVNGCFLKLNGFSFKGKKLKIKMK